jgi:carbamoyltransferase
MSGCFLGPSYGPDEVAAWLDENRIGHQDVPDLPALCRLVAVALDQGEIVGWFRGRMEFGPRALGHRSILADPRDPAMVAAINRAVKQREGFRPFAPAVLAEHASEWFEVDRELPYMLFTAPVRTDRRLVDPRADGLDALGETSGGLDLAGQLARPRSTIPACTHLDHSARLQTVDAARNPDFHTLLTQFHARTGCPVLLNTSFNRRGEPIVNTPADALRCFADVAIDLLVLENCVVRRTDLPTTADAAGPHDDRDLEPAR